MLACKSVCWLADVADTACAQRHLPRACVGQLVAQRLSATWPYAQERTLVCRSSQGSQPAHTCSSEPPSAAGSLAYFGRLSSAGSCALSTASLHHMWKLGWKDRVGYKAAQLL